MPLWRLLHVPPPRGLLRLVEFVPVVIGGLIIFAVLAGYVGGGDEAAEPTPIPVVQVPKFEPLALDALRFEPTLVRRGETATLFNGICNRTQGDVSVTFYLGAQEVGIDPLTAKTIDLIGKDTPEGRQRRTIAPGCIGQNPIVAPLPETFTTGQWRIVLRVVALGPRGEMQSLTAVSAPFWVVE